MSALERLLPSEEVTRESLKRLGESCRRVVATQERVKHLDHVVQELVVLVDLALQVAENVRERGAGDDKSFAEVAHACIAEGRLNVVDLCDEIAKRSRHLRSLLPTTDAVKADS